MSTRTRLTYPALLLCGSAIALTSCATGPSELSGLRMFRQPINQGSVVVNRQVEPQHAEVRPVESAHPIANQQQPGVSHEAATATTSAAVPAETAAIDYSPQGRSVGFTFLFPVNGTSLNIPAHVKADLIEAAKAADHITIIGRTDADRYSPADEQVALRRALAGRSILVQAGVSPTQIAIEFASAADYARSNSTYAGRQANRRVEFLLAKRRRDDATASVQ